MIKLSLKALESFKIIYFKEYGTTLNDEEATRMALALLELFRIVYRPIPKSDHSLTFNEGSIALVDRT